MRRYSICPRSPLSGITFALILLDATLFMAGVETAWSRVISTLITLGRVTLAARAVRTSSTK